MTKIADILASLKEAVNGGAALPEDQRAELYTRSFQQAGQELAKLAAPVPAETDHVSLLAAHLRGVETSLRAIEAGETQPIGGAGPSDETMTLAKAWLDLGEVVLVGMASENALPLTKGEKPEQGLALAKVAVGDGEILVKTTLPEALHGLIAPPDAIAEELAAIGKALFKFARGDEEMEAPEDPEEPGEPDGVAGALEDLAKIGQMAVMQVAAIKEEIGEGEDELGGDAGELSALDAIAAHGAFMTQQAEMLLRAAAGGGEGEEELERSTRTGDLAKGGTEGKPPAGQQEEQTTVTTDPKVAELEVKLTEATGQLAKAAEAMAAMQDRLAKLEAQPADPKAVLKGAGIALTKQADGGGEELRSPDDLAQDLAKLAAIDPQAAATTLMKMAQARPTGVFTAGGFHPAT